GHAQPVVAGGRRDHAARACVRRQRRQHVERAAELERAGGLLVLELEVDVAAGERAQCGAAQERRALDERSNAVGRGEDVGGAKIAKHGGSECRSDGGWTGVELASKYRVSLTQA